MRGKKFFIVLAFCAAFIIGCGNAPAEKAQYTNAPDFEARDINGKAVKLSDYSGKVILLNFFATWCPPCRAEMPDFNEIQKEYKKSVKIIAVNVGREKLDTVKQFADKNKLRFTIVMDKGDIQRLYGPISAIPVTIIIGKDFKIARRYVGQRQKNTFIADIKGLSE